MASRKIKSQARETTQPSAPIAVPGFAYGRPNYEARSDMTQGAKTGSYGYPGIYDTMIQQWPAVRAQWEAAKAEASAIKAVSVKCGVTTEAPDGDERPDETVWNDAVDAMLFGDRVRIESGDGWVPGFGAVLGEAAAHVFYGFGLFDPWLSPDAPATLEDGVLLLSPLLPAAVQDWGLNYTQGQRRPTTVTYRAELGAMRPIPYVELIHLVHGGGPGQPAGQGVLRPLVGPFMFWRDSMLAASNFEKASKGILTIEAPPGDDNGAERVRMQAVGQAWADDALGYVIHPTGTKLEFNMGSGTGPDFAATQDHYSRMVADVFGDGLAVLGLRSFGSRAIGETMRAADSEIDRAKLDAFVNRVRTKIAEWLARATSYTGRIRTAKTVGEGTVDVAALTTSLVTAKAEGLLTWGIEDENKLRETLGWIQATAAAVPVVAPLADRAKRAPIFARLSDREPTDEEEHPAGCGCGSHSATFADGDGYDVTTPSGRVWRSAVPIGEVEIDGHLYRPELSVTWADDDEARAQLDAELEAALAEIAALHRAATLDLLESGDWSQARSDALHREYRDLYADAIEVYARKLGDVADAQRLAEMRRQADDAVETRRTGLPTSTAVSVLDAIEQRISDGIDQAADTIANRVQSAIEGGFTGGGASGAIAAAQRQTVRGLTREAAPVGNQVEAAATVQAAAKPESGMVVIAVIRSTMRDRKVCDYCVAAEGGGTPATKLTFRFPEQTAEWRAYSGAHGPPDPNCEGGAQHCRCRWITVMGRRQNPA